jgi:hypothetical protein
VRDLIGGVVTVCVIGDVVASRRIADQARLLAGLRTAVTELDDVRSAAPTTGDEFQAVYDDLGVAVRSLAMLRLGLLLDPPADEPIELRLGLGVGVTTGDAEHAGAPGQSGPGWWHARAALEHLATPRRAWPRVLWWVESDGEVAATRATLVALDTLGARFDTLDVSLARGLLQGRTARDLAADHGITPQSVGERLHTHGVYGWVRTLETLTEERR